MIPLGVLRALEGVSLPPGEESCYILSKAACARASLFAKCVHVL